MLLSLADVHAEGDLEGLIICLIVVALAALVAYAICHLAGRPDIGRLGAAVIGVLGALLCLLGAL